jgi:hypothetical protein
MKHSSWLHGLRATLGNSANRHAKRHKRRPPQSRRARFETLEDRALLAVLTVNSPLENNTPGDGLVTLREAIRAANLNSTTDLGQTGSGADTIQIAPSVTGTISIVFGEFVVTESLSIVGPGRDVLTIDAHDASRIFNFTAQSGDFTISDLALTRGRVQGNTTLGGAGINKDGTGLLKLERVSITECNAVYTGSFNFAHGGAVSVEGGTLIIISSLLSGNQASGTAARGGAIASRARVVNIIDSVIENNKAIGSGQGGGVHAQYYSIANSPVELTLTGSTIRSNTASSGGGIYVNRAGVITGGTISGNQASNGGGIYASSGVVLQRVTVHGNSSVSMGGGVRSGGGGTIESSTVSGNTSGGGGGGLYCRVGGFVLSNSTISGNAAGEGGGVMSSSGYITIRHSTIAGNTAVNGGGVLARQGEVRAFGSIISGNTATTNPDLRSDSNKFVLDYTLVGDAAGTSVSEAQTPDARGNLIGRSVGSAIIDPKLAPLADNGGPTRTHALLFGSPAIDANLFQPSPAPARDYQLNGSLADALGGPPLIALGGVQQTERYAFSPNKGLNANSALANPAQYSIEILFDWHSLSGGWQKIIDFHNLTSNVGLYTVGNGLQFVNGPYTANLFNTSDFARLVLTRDDATDIVRAYVDGNEVWSFVDAAGDAVFDGPNQIIRFFQDDMATAQTEAGSGRIEFIRIYNAVLTTPQIEALPNPIVASQFDQRGLPRVIDGDGIGGAQMDMGAYESQGVPTDDNTSPVFTSPDSVSVPENTTIVLTVTAVDHDLPPQAITYSIVGGPDQSKFAITTGGALSFVTPPDFENPADANGDNAYVVIVQASDGSLTSLQAIVVRVTPVNDNSPVFASPATATVMENATAVMTVSATDADLPAQMVTVSIVGGADQSQFSLIAGQLAFIAPPDFESPTDADGDSIYEVVVQADDGNGRTTLQTILVTVMGPPSDYGDAPDATAGAGAGNYNTRAADGGPRHTIVPGLRIGANVDGETGTLHNAAANADDVNSALPDDEDGLTNPAADLVLTIGAQPTVNLRVTNTTGAPATLYGWIDYNADGVFDNATERASISVPTGTNNGIVTLTFPAVPSGFHGTTCSRFRLSTDQASANPTGNVADGEVEDHLATIVRPNDRVADSSKTKLLVSGMNGVPSIDPDDSFGNSLANIGDLDGDGVTDMAVGAPTDDSGGIIGNYANRGAVYVLFMNTDGSVRDHRRIAHNIGGGPSLVDRSFFGTSIASLGDLDGDGMSELAVGTPATRYDLDSRGVYVLFMNANGAAKSYQFIGNGVGGGPVFGPQDVFGGSVAGLGDLDGDGVADLAVGAPASGSEDAIYILFMNPNGTVKESRKLNSNIVGGTILDSFGGTLASLGDVDGDGLTDLAASASDGQTGAVYVLFLNTDGTAKGYQKIGSGVGGGPTLSNGDQFGSSLATLGDADGDGIADLAVGATGDDTGGDLNSSHGAVHLLLLNANGTVKNSRKIANGTGGGPSLFLDHRFGTSVISLGDLDRDGLTNLAVAGSRGSNGLFPATVHVLFLTPINTNPVIVAPPTVNVPENATPVVTVMATDAEAPPQIVTFSIAGGADQSKFRISNGGVLTFQTPPDFDAPADSNADNEYVVTVRADDGSGGSALHTINVVVTPVNDNAPVFSSSDLVVVPENTTSVLTVSATDADLPPQTVTYSLVGGSDQSKFNITSSGVLSFKSPPDFESPSDVNGDNVYIVIVEASDGSLASLQAILITVTNASEVPLAGDYNSSGAVDLADYVVWRNALDHAVTLPNDSTPGMVTQADYDVWRANFGRTAPASAMTSAIASAFIRPMNNNPADGSTVPALGNSILQTYVPPTFAGPAIETPQPPTSRMRPIGRDPYASAAYHEDALAAWLTARSMSAAKEFPTLSFATRTRDLAPEHAQPTLAELDLSFAAVRL